MKCGGVRAGAPHRGHRRDGRRRADVGLHGREPHLDRGRAPRRLRLAGDALPRSRRLARPRPRRRRPEASRSRTASCGRRTPRAWASSPSRVIWRRRRSPRVLRLTAHVHGFQAPHQRTLRTVMSVFFGRTTSVSSFSARGIGRGLTAPRARLELRVERRDLLRGRPPPLSSARPTSPACFIVRPAARAAVVARPIVVAEIALRPKSAPSTVAPTEIAVWMPACIDSCFSRPTVCSARRSRSWSAASFAAYFWRSASALGVTLLARPLLEARAEVRLALARLRHSLRRRAAEELERALAIDPGREVSAPGVGRLRRARRRSRARRSRAPFSGSSARSSDGEVRLGPRRPVDRIGRRRDARETSPSSRSRRSSRPRSAPRRRPSTAGR